jgi:hypothetical protein
MPPDVTAAPALHGWPSASGGTLIVCGPARHQTLDLAGAEASATMVALKAPADSPARFSGTRRWLAPVSVPPLWASLAFLVCAAFAGAVVLFSHNSLHRLWGMIAAGAYLLAAAVVAARRPRGIDVALGISAGGALIAPLVENAVTGRRQPEVTVITRSARALVHHSSPYQSTAHLALMHNPNAYDPYLPVMSLFGVPRAIFGGGVLTDPRIGFGLAFLVLFGLALMVAGARHVLRWVIFVAATPVIAFELAVGGTDVPIIGLMCLGLALLWRRPRYVLAGLALGVASAAKATAWPAVAIAAVFLGVRYGWRAAARFLVTAAVACAALVGPVALLWPSALVENTILFPLGLAPVKSAAASPLPGHVIAVTGRPGHMAAVVLLVLACLAVAGWVTISPPRTLPAAVWRLIIGLAVMFTLAPATRFGYFIYPAALFAWLQISLLGQQRAVSSAPGRPFPQAGARPASRVAG